MSPILGPPTPRLPPGGTARQVPDGTLSGALLQPIFVGIEMDPLCPYPAFCIYIHNGFDWLDMVTHLMGSLECPWRPEARQLGAEGGGPFMDATTITTLEDKILTFLHHYATANKFKIQAAGIGIGNYHKTSYVTWGGRVHSTSNHAACGWVHLARRLWLDLDIVPCHVTHSGDAKLGDVGRIEEMADFDARESTRMFASLQGAYVPLVEPDPETHKVVICEQVWLAILEDYVPHLSAHTLACLHEAARTYRDAGLSVSYFSSTPRGGGVAQMRHAWMRFARNLDVQASWYVSHPNLAVFEVTKRCFHNGLQGILLEHARLTYEGVLLYEAWCRENYERYWRDRIIPQSRVVVIDDPQLCGMIPLIRADHPAKPIIFRCHIAIRCDLLADPGSPTSAVWSYLWRHLAAADAFIFHPVPAFIPACIPPERVWLMPAWVDPLDGLNKPLAPDQLTHYHNVLNRLSLDSNGKTLDYAGRRYLLQISRFDPSKGITDVLDCYWMLRERVRTEGAHAGSTTPPALIIAGVGSIDDPEGNRVYEEAHTYIAQARFAPYFADILLLKVPPCDPLLNALLTTAWTYLQLSVQEGFEVKVTEAVRKGVPVIAYRTGGIALQVREGKTGYLVPTGHKEGVVERLMELLGDEQRHAALQQQARTQDLESLTVGYQACSWLTFLSAIATPEGARRLCDTYQGVPRHLDELWTCTGPSSSSPRPIEQRAREE